MGSRIWAMGGIGFENLDSAVKTLLKKPPIVKKKIGNGVPWLNGPWANDLMTHGPLGPMAHGPMA